VCSATALMRSLFVNYACMNSLLETRQCTPVATVVLRGPSERMEGAAAVDLHRVADRCGSPPRLSVPYPLPSVTVWWYVRTVEGLVLGTDKHGV
jgi:hypothetical protein